MKKLTVFAGLLYWLSSAAQLSEPITVTTQSINIAGALIVGNWINEHPGQAYPNYPKLYYAFAEGDEIIIDFLTKNKKGTQIIDVTEYESNSVVYSNNQFQSLEGVTIKVPKTAVYKFEFATNHVFDRQGIVTLKRIPASETAKNFTCNVTWKTVNDTIFTIAEEKRKVSSKLQVITMQTPINYYINSGSHSQTKGGKSRIAFPIILPDNTIEWYYTLTATRNEKDVQSTKANMNLLGQLTKLVDQTGLLSFGLEALTQPPGANYADIYLLQPEYVQAYLNKDDGNWKYVTDGSRQNLSSGSVKIKDCCTSGRYYIGLKNPDISHGVHVMIEIVAITENATYKTVQVKHPISYTTKKIPVFGGDYAGGL